MSQQDASKTRPYRGLVLDACAVVSLTVSKLGCTKLIFIEHGAKINGQYYRDVLLTQKLLPAIRSIAGDMLLCFPARQCASTSCLWQSRASAPWDTPVHQSWHVAIQQSWPQPGRLPRLGHTARVRVSSTNPQYGRVAEAPCCGVGWISVQRGGLCMISGEKDWKHVSVHKVVTLSTCCDV